jgi:CRISPR system Cascade subunit CasE
MYLSQLVVNSHKQDVYRDLADAHKLHQRIMQGFPDEQHQQPRAEWNILYRQEGDSSVLLVQSDITPDWSRLPSGYLANHNTKSLALMLNQLEVGKQLQFRLKANPSKRDHLTRKIIGLTKRSEQIEWLERQSARSGFKVLSVDVMPTPDIYGRKSKAPQPIKIFSVLFQGALQITDVELFTQALRQGIGRGRSYGCGLLSIAKLYRS